MKGKLCPLTANWRSQRVTFLLTRERTRMCEQRGVLVSALQEADAKIALKRKEMCLGKMPIKDKRGREQEGRAFGPHCRSNTHKRRKGKKKIG